MHNIWDLLPLCDTDKIRRNYSTNSYSILWGIKKYSLLMSEICVPNDDQTKQHLTASSFDLSQYSHMYASHYIYLLWLQHTMETNDDAWQQSHMLSASSNNNVNGKNHTHLTRAVNLQCPKWAILPAVCKVSAFSRYTEANAFTPLTDRLIDNMTSLV